jgi:hypothetical protein
MGTWIAIAGAACLVMSVVWLIVAYVAYLRTLNSALAGTCMACLVGGAIGSMMVYIAIEHNPQGVYVDHVTGAVNYLDLSLIFLSWSAVFSVVVSIALALVVWMARGLRAICRLLGA